MSDWIEHDGTGCPVPRGTLVEVMWEDGLRSQGPALMMGCDPMPKGAHPHGGWDWRNEPLMMVVVGYRVLDAASVPEQTQEAAA